MNEFAARRTSEVRGNDLRKARAAIQDLAMFLEQSRSLRDDELGNQTVDESPYLSEIPQRLGNVGEQAELIRELASILKDGRSRIEPSILWAIGKGDPMPSIPALLEFISSDLVTRLDLESIRQLSISLHDSLEWARDESIDFFRQMLTRNDPTEFLLRVARDEDRRVADRASDALDEVQRVLRAENLP